VDPMDAYRKVCEFLRIDCQTAQPSYGKVNPFELAEMVRNYEEVVDALSGTSFEWMLYD